MVMRYPFRAFVVLLPLFVLVACGGRIPDGWHVVDANDIERTQSLRVVTCGGTLEVGLIFDEETLPAEDKKIINGLAVIRQEADARIIRPGAQSLAALFSMTGVSVLIGDQTARSWPPLVSDKIIGTAEPVRVILDLPIENFSDHLAVLTKALSADADTDLRVMATTRQASATLSHQNLKRLESLASVCAVYPDAMLKPIGESGGAAEK
jgi:hypothetical protein